MKFSILLPSYKPQYLREAVESVINQTYSDWELVVVDDCSPSDLHSIVAPFLQDQRVHYYRNERNCGAINVVDNWNICLGYCTGDYVINMGDDDRLLPCCLEELSKIISKYPNLNVYHSRTEIIDEKGQVTEVLEERPETEDALSMMTKRWEGRKQFIGDFCFSRQHLIACNGYYPLPFAWGSDDITLFRAAVPSGIANANRPGFQYRENIYSISLSNNAVEKVSATLQLKKWHQETLAELLAQNAYPAETIHDAQRAMNHFVEGQIAGNIKRDLKQGGIKRYWYWLWHYPKKVISPLLMIKIYIFSVIQSS